jgi:tetratricopeptide (TPR) repeat protein
MKRSLSLVAVISLVFGVGAAHASEKSNRLQSRGLVEFHAGRYPEAMTLFDEAVASDPDDVYARYYRGVTRARLGDTATAISDLRAVLAAQPELDQAAVDLGVVLVQTGQSAEAVPYLEQAQRNPELAGQASLFLGVAQLRQDQVEAAEASFTRAEKDPAWANSARYYLGVVNFREGNWSLAEYQFSSIVADSPDSEMGREAAAFIERMRVSGTKVFHIYGGANFQFDSNVILAPANTALKGTQQQQSDGRATFQVGGRYTLWHSRQWFAAVGYEAYQDAHVNLSQFNVQDHRGSVQLGWNPGPFRIGLIGRYDYYLLQTNSFLQAGSALTWAEIAEANLGRMEVSFGVHRNDFKNAAFFVRDAFNYAPGARQYVYLGSPDRYVAVGYQWDREDPVVSNDIPPKQGQTAASQANAFAYDGNEVNAGFGWDFPASIIFGLNFSYRHERYAPPSNGRRDDEYGLVADWRRPLDEHIDFVLAYIGDFNNSNQAQFTYDRNIGSIGFEARF